MAGEENQYIQKYEKYVRHYKEAGWTYEKVSRMAVYVFLFNKVRGMPKSFGLSNDSVSWQFNEYIREHFAELCEKYDISNHVPGLDLSVDHFDNKGERVKGGQTVFLEEMNEYVHYAEVLSGVNGDNKQDGRVHMCRDQDMIGLMEAFTADRKKHFERIRANTKRDPGYNIDDKSKENKIGALRAEKYKMKKRIEDKNREMRETAFFAGLQGVGAVAFGGLAAVSALTIFAPGVLGIAAGAATLGRVTLGVVGMIAGGSAFSGLGRKFLNSCARFFGMFMYKRQELKKKRGEYGKRGMEDIQKSIDLNEAVKCAYNIFEKMVKEVTYYKRKEKQGPNDPEAGKLLDKDGNIINFQNGNELVAANGDRYVFDEAKRTLKGPLGSGRETTLRLGVHGKIFGVDNLPVEIEGLQVPYVEAIKQVIPTKDEFKDIIMNYNKIKDKNGKIDKKTYKMLLPLIKADEEESEFGKLWDRVKERWGYLYGPAKKTIGFVSTYKTIVEDNNEIVLEREDFYNTMFNISFEIDPGNPERPPIGLNVDEDAIDFSRYPSFEEGGKQFKYKYNLNTSVTDFVQALIELKGDETKYNEHHEQLKYQHYKTRAAEMMPVIFQRELFGKPLTGESVRNCQNLLTQDIVTETLKRSNTGDKTPYVKNALRFIIAEQYDPVNKIRTDLGVNVEDQLCANNADGIENACLNTLGLSSGSPDFNLIRNSIAPQIQNMQFKESAAGINSLIASVSDSKVRDYLYHMVEVRQNQLMHGRGYIVNEISDGDPTLASNPAMAELAEMLTNITYDPRSDTFTTTLGGSPMSEDNVRSYISSQLGSLGDEAREKAEMLFDKQLLSIERGYMDSIRAQAAHAVKTNSVSADFEDYIKFIEELQFDKLNTQELTQFMNEKLKRIQPPAMAEYLKNKLRVKLEEVINFRLSQSGVYVGENGLKEITEDLQKVERMLPIIGGARRERILKAFEPKIKIAFDKVLIHNERYLLELDNFGELTRQFKNYRDFTFEAGGFKQFFQRNSSISDEIRDRIINIETVLRYADIINGSGVGIKLQTDKRVPESKIFLGLCFSKHRGDGKDPLMSSFAKLNGFISDISQESFFVDKGTIFKDLPNGYDDDVDKMTPAMKQVLRLKKVITGGGEFSLDVAARPGDPVGSKERAQDELALLLIYKKKVLSLFKAHLKRLTVGRPDIQGYLNSDEGRAVIKEITKLWKPLFIDIDNKYEELAGLAQIEDDPMTSGYTYKPAVTTLDAALASNGLSNYVLSTDSVVMER